MKMMNSMIREDKLKNGRAPSINIYNTLLEHVYKEYLTFILSKFNDSLLLGSILLELEEHSLFI